MAGKPFSDEGLLLITKHRMLLKDYLRDDLSSCSSSGFKSFPRRHCCNTVRFLHDKDLKGNLLRRSRTKSALKKASAAVIKAVKLLPFPSIISTGSAPPPLSQRNKKASILSRKILSRSFWRKAVLANKEEVGNSDTRRWRSFREFLEEGDINKTSDQRANVGSGSRVSSSSTSSSTTSGNSCSWVESEFTSEILIRSSSGNSNSGSSTTEDDVIDETVEKKKGGCEIVGEADTRTASTCSSITNPREWTSEEKEQFSPVSILNCPFEDDEEISSPSNPRYSHLQGMKHKQMQKSRRSLEKRIALSEVENEPYNSSPAITKPCSASPMAMPLMCIQNSNASDDNYIEGNARDLVNLLRRSSTPPNCLMVKAENILFDFFKQSFGEDIHIDNNNKCRVIQTAEDWINGKPQQLYLPWEIQEGRQLYIREMDSCSGMWKESPKEKQDLVSDLEFDLFTSVVNELLLDLTSSR